MKNQKYSNEFYAQHLKGMISSANGVLPLIFSQLQISSILDVGCGRGVWLAAARDLGATDVHGIDGPWVDQSELVSDEIVFRTINLGLKIPNPSRRYDLCVCVEVAEHLPERSATDLISFLCHSSDVVLFGAAVKHQGGTNHINEQWQSYWVELFLQNGFDCHDIIRPRIWNDPNIEWWYKQNTFLFCKKNTSSNLHFLEKSKPPIYDLIHPFNHQSKIDDYERSINNPSLSLLLKILKNTSKHLPLKIIKNFRQCFIKLL